MKNIYSGIWTLMVACIFIIYGCSKDKGNYDYRAINQLTVKVDKDTFSVKLYDTLKINPLVNATMEGNLSYLWYINGNAINTTNIQLSTSKNLSASITVAPATLPYNLYLRITDSISGVSSFYTYKLLVTGQYTQGLMVLESYKTGMDVSLIDPNFAIFRNVYSKANNDVLLPANSYKVASLNSLLDQTNYVLNKDGITQMNKITFSFLAGFNELVYEKPPVVKPESIDFQNTILPALYLINNGLLYYYNTTYGAGKMGSPVYGDYHLAPYMAMGTGTIPLTVFDDKNGRFLNLPGIVANTLVPYTPKPDTIQPFNLNNVKDSLLTMQRGVRGLYYGIFKNKTNNNRYLYSIDQNNKNVNLISAGYQQMLNSPELDQASLFTFSWSVSQLYYSTGNKVYLYDMLANTSRLLFQFPVSEQITVMEMEHVSVNAFIAGTPNENKRIAVATYDGTQGRVYYLGLTATGDLVNNTYAQKFEGFGKIASVAYKINK